MSELARTLRRHLLQLVVSVLVLDGVAIAIYRLTPLHGAQERARMLFTLVWTLATLAVVLTGLRRIRATRLVARRAAARDTARAAR